EENKMKRSITLLIGILTFCGIGLIASSAMAIDGPLANATVSFGEWKSDFSPPLHRIVGDPAAGAGNNHELILQIATIKQRGAVNFIISGGHVVTVYDDGTQPEDIGGAIEPNCVGAGPFTAPCSPLNAAGQPAAGGILSDSDGRIYRGAFLNLV